MTPSFLTTWVPTHPPSLKSPQGVRNIFPYMTSYNSVQRASKSRGQHLSHHLKILLFFTALTKTESLMF